METVESLEPLERLVPLEPLEVEVESSHVRKVAVVMTYGEEVAVETCHL